MSMRIVPAIPLAVLVTSAAAEPSARISTIANWSDMRTAFVKCWTVPEGTEGSLIAFTFLVAPNGGMKGPPRLLGRVLRGSPDAQQRFLASAYETLNKCLPFDLSPSFRSVMGETMVNLRLVNTSREPARNLGPWMSIFAEETRSPSP